MPISFGENSGGGGSYIRVNMPQNRWRFISDGNEQDIDMSRGLAIAEAKVKMGLELIDVRRSLIHN